MSSYLAIAEEVLRRIRRPMTAMQILRAAYSAGIAPPHLRGRTQGKTMGARLSEDILQLREESRFYRTAPGRFLLRELMHDPGIPEDLRRPIVARRRRRALTRDRALTLRRELVDGNSEAEHVISRPAVLRMIRRGDFHYTLDPKRRSAGEVIVWSFVLVIRSGFVLSYRQGSYREDRDTFMHRRTIGFYAPVAAEDLGLFDQADHGIVSSGVRALAMDLDLLDRPIWTALTEGAELRSFVLADDGAAKSDLLAVVVFSCPDWLDPTSKRLAINDLEWLDLRVPRNHDEDFDPWSRAILSASKRLALAGS